MAIPQTIQELASKVRNAVYGKEVRESIAESIEVTGNTAQIAKDTAEEQIERVDNIIAQAGNDNTEIVDARGGEVILGNRLNKVDAQLAQKASQNDLTALETQVSNLGDGSPKGVYATLIDLQNAFPTGATGVYVVTADGNWYYWNGTTWTSGGVYQSTQWLNALTTQNAVWSVE